MTPRTPTLDEPRTPTGRWLADWVLADDPRVVDRLPEGWDDPYALIAKVEAEARQAALDEVERVVRELPSRGGPDWPGLVRRAAVLQAISQLRGSHE